MKISVITCCYNSGKTIEQALHSFLSQDYPNKELVVIDGASSDDTLNILEKYREQIDVLVSEKDSGIYNAMNKGVALASGTVFGFLHSDDLFADAGVLSRIAAKMLEDKSELCYGDLVYTDVRAEKVIRTWKSGSFSKAKFRRGWMPPHPTVYVKRDLIETYGTFNEAFRIAGDYEFLLRYMYLADLKLSYIPEVLVKMRIGGESNQSIKNRLKANAEDRKAWRIHGLNPYPTSFLKPLRKLFQFAKRDA